MRLRNTEVLPLYCCRDSNHCLSASKFAPMNILDPSPHFTSWSHDLWSIAQARYIDSWGLGGGSVGQLRQSRQIQVTKARDLALCFSVSPIVATHQSFGNRIECMLCWCSKTLTIPGAKCTVLNCPKPSHTIFQRSTHPSTSEASCLQISPCFPSAAVLRLAKTCAVLMRSTGGNTLWKQCKQCKWKKCK